ncbi:transcriptional activator [Cryptococcus deuterogattii R265]|uniref:transcriptional activator n=1 Tax=Cryptococcus deuterogattii (strain R265) TaxID=294750 RepID=UPI001935E532|nr:transcriptional activator [Cryptococcus deuterogattii R265]
MSSQQREPSPDLSASPVTPVNVSASITNANSAATSSASGAPQAVSESSANGSQPLSPGRKRRKVTRSRLGCLTCRKRRKLCDMTKPICQACTRLKIECSWPSETTSKPPRSSSQRQSQTPAISESPSVPPTNLDNMSHSISPYMSHGPTSAILPYPYTPSRAPAPSTITTGLLSASNTLEDFTRIFGHIEEDRVGLQMDGQTVQPYTIHNVSAVPGADIPGLNAETELMDWLNGSCSLDESTLQLWAADCLAVPTTQTFNAFDSLNSLLQPTPPSHDHVEASQPAPSHHPSECQPPRPTSHPGSARQSPPHFHSPSRRSDRATPTNQSQTALLHYFHDSLARLVSCTEDASSNAFEAFTKLSNMTAGQGAAGQGLHLSILAWAARHAVNKGLVKYEAASEKFSSQSTTLVDTRMRDLFDGDGNERRSGEVPGHEKDREYMTLLAANLMLMQFKICRGDVWGFDTVVRHLTLLVPFVFRTENDFQAESMHHQFFENVLYHDVLGSFILNRAPMIPSSLVSHYCSSNLEALNTLTGASLPLFSTMHRLAALVRQRRERRGKGWSDENLFDAIQRATELEKDLANEKERLDALVLAKPHVKPHRYLHEAFRTTCLIQLHHDVLCEPPSSLHIHLLVRQSLSLLEAMIDQSLPGLCSAHWVIFLTALCCVAGGQDKAELDDRERVERIYDDILHEYGFLNVERSRKIVHEVWARNQGGQLHMDWLDLLEEYDWEIFVV